MTIEILVYTYLIIGVVIGTVALAIESYVEDIPFYDMLIMERGWQSNLLFSFAWPFLIDQWFSCISENE